MTRPATSRGRAAALSLLVGAALLLPGAPTLGAASADCRVVNAASGESYGSLGIALGKAQAGATLGVWGTCRGGLFVQRDVTLRGYPTPGQPRGVIDGRNVGKTTLTVAAGVTVRLRMIRVQGGDGGIKGGGIRNNGDLYLADSVVRQGTADRGGGIWNRGRLVLRENSSVRRNVARDTGGGIWNEAGGSLSMEDTARVVRNRALGDYAGGVLNYGTLRLVDESRIFRNRAAIAGGGLAAIAEAYECPAEHIVSNAPDDCYLIPV
ncbi:MAG: hypothetical protein ACKOTZ_09825 [Chloroflexota bacterium]